MLVVVMKDGNVREFRDGEFTDYEWCKTAFVVMKGNRWVALFNWDEVKEVFYND